MTAFGHEFTAVLHRARAGDTQAQEQLWTLVYDQLRHIAHEQLRVERRDHTLSTTGLVHETYLRLVDRIRVPPRDRVHFLAVAARAMRQILVDHARKRKAQKRGGGRPDVAFDEALYLADERAEELLALDEALSRLEKLNRRLSQVIECCYFGGLTQQEAAEIIGVSVRTVERDWVKAKGWLYHELYG